jgi:hypothetical protein
MPSAALAVCPIPRACRLFVKSRQSIRVALLYRLASALYIDVNAGRFIEA